MNRDIHSVIVRESATAAIHERNHEGILRTKGDRRVLKGRGHAMMVFDS